MNATDTIAAIATAPGRGGVAVVRVSGDGAFAVARALTGRVPAPGRVTVTAFFAPATTSVRQQACCRTLVVSPTPPPPAPRNPQPATRNLQPVTRNLNLPLDTGLLLAFKSPHSYTGEDVVEFQCHGGTVTPRRILEACFAAGARLARRGEFTERAFLNGKLDLSAAESVIDLVDAKTERAADAALHGLSGERRRAWRALYDEAIGVSATLEHALDVDESDLDDRFFSSLAERLAALRAAVDAAIRAARAGRVLRDGALVVLAGAPNAGKSSLLNALVGESRAIVSDEPGTTRDAIETWLDIDGWPVRLVDTAGLRAAAGAVERAGIAKAEDLVRRADLVLALAEPGGAFPAGDSAKTIRVATKSDLGVPPAPDPGALSVSAATGAGLAELKAAVAAFLAANAADFDEPADDASRAIGELVAARAALESAGPVAPDADLVLAANAVRSAAEALGRLTGAVYTDDLLDALFSRFCVGK